MRRRRGGCCRRDATRVAYGAPGAPLPAEERSEVAGEDVLLCPFARRCRFAFGGSGFISAAAVHAAALREGRVVCYFYYTSC